MLLFLITKPLLSSSVKTAPVQTQSPVNSVSLAEELHCADFTFQPSPDDDRHYPKARRVYVPPSLNSLGSPEDIDTIEPDACSSSGFSHSEAPAIKQELCPTVESEDERLRRRATPREKAILDNLEKTQFVGAATVRLPGHYLGDQTSSPTRCDKLTSSAPQPFDKEDTSKSCGNSTNDVILFSVA